MVDAATNAAKSKLLVVIVIVWKHKVVATDGEKEKSKCHGTKAANKVLATIQTWRRCALLCQDTSHDAKPYLLIALCWVVV